MSLATTRARPTTDSVDERATCPECDGTIRSGDTEAVCEDCGLIVAEDRLDRGPEWRTATVSNPQKGDPRRTGAPRTVARHDRGLSTDVGTYTDVRQLSGSKQRRFYRLRRQHKRAQIGDKKARNEVYTLTEIRRITGDVDLPDSVRDRACRLFQAAHEADAIRGRGLDGFAAASVYAAGRQAELSRTFDEIATAARVDQSTVRVCYRALIRTLDLAVGPPQPREYLPRVADAVDVPAPVEQAARQLLVDAGAQATNGRKPQGVAAAAIYAVTDDVTQATVADAADVCIVTIRNTVAALQDDAGA